jgi:N-acetylglucosamine transport system permease protein
MSAPLKETAPTGGTVPPQPSVGKPSARPGEPRGEGVVLNAFSHGFLALWALLIVLPLLWLVFSSFKTDVQIGNSAFGWPHNWTFDVFRRAWSKGIGDYFLNTLIVLVFSVPLTMLFGSMAAYVLARYRFFGNRFIYYLFVSGLAFPTFMALAPLFFILKGFGLLNSYTGLILVYIAYSLPFTVFFLAAFFAALPYEIEEAATVDGASHTRKFFQIMVPMARSGLVSITIFNIVGQWNQYLLPVVIMQGAGADTKWVLTQGIANISVSAGYHAQWSTLFAALTLSIIPMIIVYAIFQRQIQAGLTAGAVK